jgi:nickel-dependent lactate racemase
MATVEAAAPGAAGALTEAQVLAALEAGIPRSLVEGRRVLVLTPDATRTCPLPFMVRALHRIVSPHAARLDFMVALGTHQPLSEPAIDALYGIGPGERSTVFRDTRFLNHRWDLEGTLRSIGGIEAGRIADVTGGLFREGVGIDINAAVLDCDLLLILGPVFPHEVAGFSGGHKYLFPGISGGEFLHFFHWLGAVHTVWKTIGVRDTPVRAVLEEAAAMVPVDRHCIAMVVNQDGSLAGLFAGDPREAWARAADLSARVHVVYKRRPFETVLGLAPRMYDELWTAAKVMYKLEPVVADGGRLIIHAPHVTELSRTWGALVRRVGYHVRDYFLSRMDDFAGIPRAVLAHSTHVRGVGTFVSGVERPRIEVVLATGIPEKTCREVGLGYADPASIDPGAWAGREDEGILVVPHAGEILHRLESERPGGTP